MFKMKLGLSLALCIVFSSMIGTVFADDSNVIYRNIFLETEEAPMIPSGKTPVPISTIANTMGADVTWDARTKTTTIKKNNMVTKLTIGSKTIVVTNDGVKSNISLDVPIQTIDGRTMVPIDVISNIFGEEAYWYVVTKVYYTTTDEFPSYVLIDSSHIPTVDEMIESYREPTIDERVLMSDEINVNGLTTQEITTIKEIINYSLWPIFPGFYYDKLNRESYTHAITYGAWVSSKERKDEGLDVDYNSAIAGIDPWKIKNNEVNKWLKEKLKVDIQLEDGDMFKFDGKYYEDYVNILVKVKGKESFIYTNYDTMVFSGQTPEIKSISKVSENVFNIKFDKLYASTSDTGDKKYVPISIILERNGDNKFNLLYYGHAINNDIAKKYA
ncbi:MAG: copper amine oxidase N-terminal domain-containing protein [Filifactoraceae bacterium]